MKTKSLVVMTVLALLLATTMVTIVAAQPTTGTEFVWRIVMDENGEYDIHLETRGEDIFWQTHKHDGAIYEDGTKIGDVTMQILLVVDMTSGKGHANVKFIMSTTDYGEIKGVMNGKLLQVMNGELEQYVDGRFVGNGGSHIQGIVTDVGAQPEVIELIGYKW